MRGSVLGVEKETYFNSYLDSPRQGTGVMPRVSDWDVF